MGSSAIDCSFQSNRYKAAEVPPAAIFKTTGGKGLHIVTPPALTKDSPWKAAKTFAHDLCVAIARDDPEHFVLNMAKKQRTGRIFLDYLRNDRMATAVGPLSPRARPYALVSMPVLGSSQSRFGSG